jgi:integrase
MPQLPAPQELPLLRAEDALDPSQLARLTEEAVKELMRQGQSANTEASYAAATRYWAAWYGARYGLALQLPVPVQVVVQFIVDHTLREETRQALGSAAVGGGAPASGAALPTSKRPALVFDLPSKIDASLVALGVKGKLGPFALNTLVHRITVLSKAHQLHELDTPCSHPGVRELLRKVRRAYAEHGIQTKKQSALTKEPMDALLATCDDSLRGKRDRALLLFAWASGGRRRSEVTSATIENLRTHGQNFLYHLGRSKGNHEDEDDGSNHKPIRGKAAHALREWLAASKVEEGPIFRSISKTGKVAADPLHPESVRQIVQRRCRLAGLVGQFSAHSLRAGFVTEAGNMELSPMKAMLLTGHKRVETFMGYYCDYAGEDVLKNEAGMLMEDDDDGA